MVESADQTESEWHDRIGGLQSISSFNELPKDLKAHQSFRTIKLERKERLEE